MVRWLRAGAAVPGIVGFAARRTRWHDALVDVLSGSWARPEAVERIADRSRRPIAVDRAAAPTGLVTA